MELNYVKRPENSLLSELDKIVNLETAQNYIPIYDKFFNLTETTYNSIQLNNSSYLSNIETKIMRFNWVTNNSFVDCRKTFK